MERIYIEKGSAKIEKTDLYLVKLTLSDGTVYENLEPRMLFPFTKSTEYITLLDSSEKEIALIRSLDVLDGESKKAIEDCFREYYMIPKIIRVLDCYDRYGKLKWTVETDRGEISFQIRNHHSDIKHLYGTNRIIVRDSNDNRYEIKDYTKLDAKSTRLLFSYL